MCFCFNKNNEPAQNHVTVFNKLYNHYKPIDYKDVISAPRIETWGTGVTLKAIGAYVYRLVVCFIYREIYEKPIAVYLFYTCPDIYMMSIYHMRS